MRTATGSPSVSSTFDGLRENSEAEGTATMDVSTLECRGPSEWRIPPQGAMRVPGIIYADRDLIEQMDEKVREQVMNVE